MIYPILVPLAGLEPARMLLRGILSPLRLPIPPHERVYDYQKKNSAPIKSAEFLFGGATRIWTGG